MESSIVSRVKLVRVALAAVFAFVLALAFAPAQAHATLTAGDISESTPPIQTYLGKSWSPTMAQCYSPAAGKLIVGVRLDSDATFYQFRVAQNSAFTKGVKVMTGTSNTVKFTGLKGGKKYYVQARSFGDKIDGAASGKWRSDWTVAKSLTVCAKPKAKKSKMTGKWKLVSSSVASSLVKYNNRHGGKFILTLKKSGKGTMRDYDRSKKSLASWGATSKKAGVIAFNSYWAQRIGDYATAKVKGKKLTFKTNAGVKMTFKRMR